MKSTSLLALVVCLVVRSHAFAAVPQAVTVQGMVLTSGGVPATGSFQMTFRLLAQASGGSPLWSQTVDDVEIKAGLFDVDLAIPVTALAGDPALWLETQVETETLPRRPLGTVPYALAAERANTALVAADLSCSGCVQTGEVAFPYAGSATKGGAASDLDCSGCVASADIATGAIASAHLQDGAVTAAKLASPYAGGASPGGAATDLACTGCVAGGEIAANATLAGDVTITGNLSACTAYGGAYCGVKVAGAGLYDHKDTWLTVRASGGLRVRTADPASGAYAPAEFGGGTSYGTLAVASGDLTVAGKVGVGTTAPVETLDVRGSLAATAGLRAGFSSLGSSGYHPDATLYLRDPGWWTGVVKATDTPWVDQDSFVFNTGAAGRPFVWTVGGLSAPLMMLDTDGRLGVGTMAPATSLDVAGSVRIGQDAGACNAGKSGALRWTGTELQVCDGAAWTGLGGGGSSGPDGSTQQKAAASCAAIAKGGASVGNGVYWIDTNGGATDDAYRVWCEMSIDGGGWTLVMNLDTSDGHVMWWGNGLWIDNQTKGDSTNPFGGDLKSAAWMSLSGSTKILVVIHEQGQMRGWKSFLKSSGATMYQHMQGGDNVLIGATVLGSSTGSVWGNERLVRLSTSLYANHCTMQNGNGCVTATAIGSDGDRIGSHEATPSDNVGGALGNWHDMGGCCSGSYTGRSCSGVHSFRTCSEAQSGWAPCYGGTGMFGTDSCGTPSATCSDSSCSNACWSQKNNINYDYSIYLGGP